MTQTLLAYLSSDFTSEDATALARIIAALASGGPWTIEPPRFVDDLDSSSCTAPDDEPIRTVGAVLLVTSPREVPETPLNEPTRFLETLAQFSRQQNVELEVQLDETYVGEIRGGELDHLLREGLLGRWTGAPAREEPGK